MEQMDQLLLLFVRRYLCAHQISLQYYKISYSHPVDRTHRFLLFGPAQDIGQSRE